MTLGLSFSLLFLLLGFISTSLLTLILTKVARRIGLLDVPNERSSHSSPVPRGGGVAVIITFFVFLYVYQDVVDVPVDAAILKSLLLGGFTIAVVGAFDDLNHIPAKWRILTHLGAVFLSLSLLPGLPGINVFGSSIDLGGIGYVFLVISLVWFVNLFNFMDGIDGLAGIEAISVLVGAGLILYSQDQLAWLALMYFLSACVAGFLLWNWPPAKVFMGDACSGFLGFTLGLLAIVTSAEGGINLWAWLILCGVFVVDSTTTLIRRIVSREKWYEAHRSHAYQILSRRVGSHRKVSVGVSIINVLWLFPLAYLAVVYSYWALIFCCIALLPLLIIALRVRVDTKQV